MISFWKWISHDIITVCHCLGRAAFNNPKDSFVSIVNVKSIRIRSVWAEIIKIYSLSSILRYKLLTLSWSVFAVCFKSSIVAPGVSFSESYLHNRYKETFPCWNLTSSFRHASIIKREIKNWRSISVYSFTNIWCYFLYSKRPVVVFIMLHVIVNMRAGLLVYCSRILQKWQLIEIVQRTDQSIQ
jgi:hypothetical protein